MDFMFTVFPIFFIIMFVVVLGVILVTLFRGIKQWDSNNKSPRLTVEATVVAKRTDVRHHNHNNSASSYSSTYYATFQVASGDRMELCVSANQIGYIVEGDRGMLTFQGTRFLSFERVNPLEKG